MTAHQMGTFRSSREDAAVGDAGFGLPAEGVWAAIGIVAAVIAPLVFGWGGVTLPAVLFLVLCPFVVAGMLIADVAPEEKDSAPLKGDRRARRVR